LISYKKFNCIDVTQHTSLKLAEGMSALCKTAKIATGGYLKYPQIGAVELSSAIE